MTSWRSIIEQNLRDSDIEPTPDRVIRMLEMLLNQSRLETEHYKRGCSQAYLAGKLSKSGPPTFGVKYEAAKETDQ